MFNTSDFIFTSETTPEVNIKSSVLNIFISPAKITITEIIYKFKFISIDAPKYDNCF